MADGSNLAKSLVEAPALPESPVAPLPELDDFDSEELGLQYYSPGSCPPDLPTSRHGRLDTPSGAGVSGLGKQGEPPGLQAQLYKSGDHYKNGFQP